MGKPTSVVVVSLVTALILGAGNTAMASGIRSANDYSLSTGPTYQKSGDRIHRYVSETFTLVNGNAREILIRKVGQDGPGLQLLVSSGSGKAQKLTAPTGPGRTKIVPPHRSTRLTVWFRVSDCVKVPRGSWPLTMDVARNSGKWQRISLQMPSGSVPWPRSMTDSVCP